MQSGRSYGAAKLASAGIMLLLSACSSESPDRIVASADDPVVASALNDPLMVDPDLAYRNQANAALTIAYDHALPPFAADAEAARNAREEARLLMLETGEIAALPSPEPQDSVGSLSGVDTAIEMVLAHNIAENCAESLRAGFSWAASLPDAAGIMPHGQVRAAAGGKVDGCELRVVRYNSPASIEDTLEYHFNSAERAGLDPQYFDSPEAIVVGSSETEMLAVHARPGVAGMTEVDLIHRIGSSGSGEN